MKASSKPGVVVIGSLHYDIMVDAPDRPRKGETITGFSWRPKFGGKGGNQAVAAAKAGAEVRMAGAVGIDEFGRLLVDGLVAAGVDATRVARIADAGSGMSVAISDAAGEYGAVIVSGANLLIDTAFLDDPGLWQGAGALVLQNEVLEATNLAAARVARSKGVMVCLNAAPYRTLPDELAGLIDCLVVNALEAEALCGIVVSDLASADAAAAALSSQFPAVVVTAGSAGVAGIRRGEGPVVLPALPVDLISTHGAGDVFVGALVAAIASGEAFAACLHSANSAAAAHVSKRAGT